MTRALRTGDEAARREAATNLSTLSLGDLGTAIHAIGVAMVSDPSAEVRAEASRTMGTLGSEAITQRDGPRRDQALGAFLAAFDDKDAQVRETAVSMIPILVLATTNLSANSYDLAPMGAPKAVVAKLLPMLNDPNESVRATVATALGRFPLQLDDSLPMLLKAAAAEPAPERGKPPGLYTGLLRKARPLQASVPMLVEALKSPDPRTRSLAVTTLGQASDDAVDAVPDLIKILTEVSEPPGQDDPGRAAATALGEIAPGTPRANEALAALQEAKGSAPEGRQRAIATAIKAIEAASAPAPAPAATPGA